MTVPKANVELLLTVMEPPAAPRFALDVTVSVPPLRTTPPEKLLVVELSVTLLEPYFTTVTAPPLSMIGAEIVRALVLLVR